MPASSAILQVSKCQFLTCSLCYSQAAQLAAQQEQAQRLSPEELQAEAAAKGYGRLYAVFGGGREGLEACAAGEALGALVGGQIIQEMLFQCLLKGSAQR